MAEIVAFPFSPDNRREPLVAVPLVPWSWRLDLALIGQAPHHLDALRTSSELVNSDADWISGVQVRGREIHVVGVVNLSLSTSQAIGLLELIERRRTR